MKKSHFLAAASAALVAAASAAGATARSTGSPPGVFVARYHLSGYGVFHENTVFTYTAAPCQAGGHGGGEDGTIRNDTTIRWESVRPATVMVERIAGHTAMLPQLDPKAHVPGAIATATVTSTTTDNRTRISCSLNGDPLISDEPGKQERTQCGTHRYPSGYWMGTTWPTVQGHPGERISVGVVSLPATGPLLPVHWGKCWSADEEIDSSDGAEINAPLPFADLPRKVRGKLTVIAHGGKVRLDSGEPQNGGGTAHYHHEFNGTTYVTWIRTG